MPPKLSRPATTAPTSTEVSAPTDPAPALPTQASAVNPHRLQRSPARSARIAGMPDRAGSSPARADRPFDGLAEVAPETGTPPARPSTPVQETGMPQLDAIAARASTRLLAGCLGSPVLAQLAVHLQRELPSAWAFTGSVAMNIHAVALEGRKIRDFADVDIQIDPAPLAAYIARIRDPGITTLITPPPEDDSGDLHYRFNGLLVDLVKNKPGMLPALSEQESVAGIPVLSLAALRVRKGAECNNSLEPRVPPRQGATYSFWTGCWPGNRPLTQSRQFP